MRKTLPNARHHIHTLQDAIELIEQKGLTVGRSYDNCREFYAESTEPLKGYKDISRMSVRKYKVTGELQIITD